MRKRSVYAEEQAQQVPATTMAYLAAVHLFLLLLVFPSFTAAAADSSQSPPPPPGSDDNKQLGTRWAVLVAGSMGYMNYRHQADVCHAYQVLKKGGLREENIIVFMYDDIANSTENPAPGTLINHPHGKDVYAGVPKDYVGEDVNVNNFRAVLLGNESALTGNGSGKVLRSGHRDHVFVFYTDHGGPGMLGMPNFPYLLAPDLMSVLTKMHASKSYKSLVFYLEACESGSMFEGLLPNDTRVLAVTASNAEEDSYATYCPGGTPEPPPGYDVCLGDLFSVSWMEDSETHDLWKRTLKEQYDYVENRTSAIRIYDLDSHVENRTSVSKTYDLGSHVMQYGETGLNSEFLAYYVGSGLGSSSASGDESLVDGINGSPTASTAVSQHDADLVYLWNKLLRSAEGSSDRSKALKELVDVLSHRLHVDSSMASVGKILFGSERGSHVLSSPRAKGLPLVDDWDCLRTMVRAFESHCGSLDRYGLKYTRALANICNAGITVGDLTAAASQACRDFPTNPLSSLRRVSVHREDDDVNS